MSENKDTRTASQRLDDLERVCATIFSATQELIRVNNEMSNLVADVPLLKDAAKLLNRRIEAVVEAANGPGGLTNDNVNAAMVRMNTEELKSQVAAWVASGALVPSDAVAADSFVVAEEFDADGKTFPRIQFPMTSQGEEVQSKLNGAKVGDSVDFGDGKRSLKVQEIYTVPAPAAETPAPAEPAAAPDAIDPTTQADNETIAAETANTEAVPTDTSAQ